MKIAAIVLICAGVVGLIMGTISFTTREKVVDIGPIQVTKEKTHSQQIPLAAGVLAVAAGSVMLLMSSRQH